MSDFPVIDTHVHFWDPGRLRYPWLDDIPELHRPFLPASYREATGSVPLAGLVFVQCECEFAQGLEEVDWILSLAREEPRLRGLVAWAPLHEGERSGEYMDALVSRGSLIKGVRRLIQSETDLEFCLRPDFLEGVRTLASYHLSFDICISHLQLANAVDMVRLCPDVPFVLDHIAKPDIKNLVVEPWKTEIERMSRLPNVACKISGLVTEASHESWTREDLRPYIDHVIDCFGFDRVLYGSDWPVATLATEYPRWVETLAWAVEECSEEEKRKLFHDNAVRIYRLGPPPGCSS